MEIKILQVFYGKDGLPYKDKDRQVHFPIAGTGFLGASNTTKIKFYYDELDNLDETTWVAVSKLPNGKVGSRVLESYLDDELNEHYALLEIDNYYTQYKGDVFISLQGYQGGVDFDYDEENSQYEIHGTPTIAATGSIKFTINYANQFVGSGETDNINFQRILAALGTKLGMRAYSEHVEELPSEGSPDVFYVVNDEPSNPNLANIYVWNENTRHYIWVGDNTLDLGDYYTKDEGNAFEEKTEGEIETIRHQVQSAVQGGPKGVYATVSALTTADPDHDYFYLVLADNHIYYWDGTQWADGGAYFGAPFDANLDLSSTNAAQNRIVSDALKDFATPNPITLSQGYENNYYTVSDGAIVEHDGSYYGFTSCHFTKANAIKQISCTVLSGNAGVIITKDSEGNIDISGATPGALYVEIKENITDIYLNLWTSSYISNLKIYTKKLIDDETINAINERNKRWTLWTDKIVLTKGTFNGYFFNSTTGKPAPTNAEYSYSHFTKEDGITHIKVTSLQSSAGPFWIYDANGNLLSPSTFNAGTYDYDVPEGAEDIYLNFFGSSFWTSIEIQTKKLISKERFDEVENRVVHGNNLAYVTVGCYYDYNSGLKYESDAYSYTQFIEISPTDTIWVNKTYHHITYWDKNKVFISGELQTTTTPLQLTIPAGAKYVVISGGNSTMGDLMVNKGESALPYEPYVNLLNPDILVPEVVQARGGYPTLNDRMNALLPEDSRFKPYAAGWQHFTVPVNQYIVDNTDTDDELIDSESNIVNVDCVLKMPVSYTPTGKPVKLLMICHGAGRGVYGDGTSFDSQGAWINITSYNDLVNKFVNAGYLVFDCNGYANTQLGCTFWGAPRGVEAWRKAYDYVVNNYNVEHSFSIYCFSMGGLTGLNLVLSNFPNVKCIALGSPVTALNQATYNNAGSALLDAYGMQSWDADAPELVGNDPQQSIIELSSTDYCFKNLPPLKIWFGGNETWPEPNLALKLVNAIKNAGGKADFRLVDGTGHEICYGANDNINTEYLYFINRFND